MMQVPRVKYSVFFALIDFIYTDTLHSSLNPKSAAALLLLAIEYQLPRLVDICEGAIAAKVQPGPQQSSELLGDRLSQRIWDGCLICVLNTGTALDCIHI